MLEIDAQEKISIHIRPAKIEDAVACLKIYAPYVEKTAITFEYEIPSVEEFTARMKTIQQKYPYLVAERYTKDGRGGSEIVGYAYTHAFVGRQAYDWSAETTIYVQEDCRKDGVGKRLYQTLEEISVFQNISNLYACIGYPQKEDEYLTKNSVQFHRHLGYREAGRFRSCGYKFGRWYDMIWMEKIIGIHQKNQPAVIPFPKLKNLQKNLENIDFL